MATVAREYSEVYFSFPDELWTGFDSFFACNIRRAAEKSLSSDTVALLVAARNSFESCGSQGRIRLGAADNREFADVCSSLLLDVIDFHGDGDDCAEDEDYLSRRQLTTREHSALRQQVISWREGARFTVSRDSGADTSLELSDQLVAFRTEVEEEAKLMVAHACEILRSKDSPVKAYAAFGKQLVLKMDWSHSRARSNGGIAHNKPWVSLALHDLSDFKDTYTFLEYGRIRESPLIGSLHGGWRNYLAALIAHEVAHAAQHSVKLSSSKGKKLIQLKEYTASDMAKPHGLGWQDIYRYLRVSWVNKLDGHNVGVIEP